MSQKCCLAGIGETKLTKNSFISSCLARQAKKIRFDPCPDCKKGSAIKAGEWIGSPEGITIYIPDNFKPGPVIIPDPKKQRKTGRRTIYPFTTMKIGDTCKDEAKNRKTLRNACGKIARNHCKKFKNKIDGDFIIFERVE